MPRCALVEARDQGNLFMWAVTDEVKEGDEWVPYVGGSDVPS